jgi:hypothetical protein
MKLIFVVSVDQFFSLAISGSKKVVSSLSLVSLTKLILLRRIIMAEPKLELEQRVDRIELAVSTMAEKLDMPEINQILAGGALEGVSDEPVFGGDHYPAAERQDEPGPEVPGERDEQD